MVNRFDLRYGLQLSAWIDQRLINERACQLLYVRHTAVHHHALNHANEDNIVIRVHPEPCAGCAIPQKRSLANNVAGLDWIGKDSHVKTESETRTHTLKANPVTS